MTWANHSIVAVIWAWGITGNAGDAALAMLGSHIPDAIETIGSHRILEHRGISHELVTWLVVLGIAAWFLHTNLAVERAGSYLGYLPAILRPDPLWFLGGAILHLVGDMLTPGGITVLGRKVSLRLFVTRSAGENIFTSCFALLSGVFLIAARYRNQSPQIMFLCIAIAFAFTVGIFRIYPGGYFRTHRKRRSGPLAHSSFPGSAAGNPGKETAGQSPAPDPAGPGARETDPPPEKIIAGQADPSVKQVNWTRIGKKVLKGNSLVVKFREIGMPVSVSPAVSSPSPAPARSPAPDSAPSGSEAASLERIFDHAKTKEEWWTLVAPHMTEFRRKGMLNLAVELFRTMDREGWTTPSVFTVKQFNTPKEDEYQLLSWCSLANHSFRVARLCYERVRNSSREELLLQWPRFLVAALGHDLGKLPSVWRPKGEYSNAAHPAWGAECLFSLFNHYAPDCPKPERDQVIEMVKKHHMEEKDKFTPRPQGLDILQQCDQEARMLERDLGKERSREYSEPETAPQPSLDPLPACATTDRPAPVKPAKAAPVQPVRAAVRGTSQNLGPFVKYIDVKRNGSIVPVEIYKLSDDFVDEILDRFKDNINLLRGSTAFYAVSQPDGNVYCWIDQVYRSIQETARARNWLDDFFHEKRFKESVLYSFVDALRQRGWIDEKLISERFYANWFHYWNAGLEEYRNVRYMPIRSEAFRIPLAELEQKRQDTAKLKFLEIKKGKFSPAVS